MDEIVGEFLVESYENLDRLDQDLVTLEDSPADKQLLGGIFRTIHTIKGTCGFLGYSKLEALAHAGENLLSKMRDGELTLNQVIATELLAMVDGIRQMLNAIEADGTEGSGDYSATTHNLHQLLEGGSLDGASAPAAADKPTDEAAPTEEAAAEDVAPTEEAGDAAPAVVEVSPEPVVEAAAPVVEVAPEPAPVAEVAPAKTEAAHHDAPAGGSADSTIRVDVSLLDTLMNLVSELVLARNQINQAAESNGDNDIVSATQRLNLITTELQEAAMKTRLQPIGNVLGKFPRVVRDLALQLGKQVRIELVGKETELDKTINEAIKDPLTHLIRNSVDHGVEASDVRVANGKPAEGRVILRAFHEGGQVNIEIEDDGAGIDAGKIKAKALEKGIITADQAARMDDRSALQLIFAPGFSTAEKVTNVSGRGVGMDVVKTNIEAIGGTVDVSTVPGQGTTFKIKIPLTLAIIPALLVTSNSDCYAIPQVSLLELVRLEGDDVHKGIEMIHGAPVYRLRGKLLPLAHLGHELSGTDLAPWGGPTEDDKVLNIVVLQADGRSFGLVVEDINDTQEIVVKPLDPQLKNIPAFAGATIMGDGRVALILDAVGLAHKAHVISEARTKALAAAGDTVVDASTGKQTLLVLQAGDRRVAVPLDLVARLEEFERSAIEQANGHAVVQYRGEIMPLLDVASALGAGWSQEQDQDKPVSVVVYSANGHSAGLLVDEIVDIVEELQSNTVNHESAVISGKVTDIIDVMELVRQFHPEFFETPGLGDDFSTSEEMAGAQ